MFQVIVSRMRYISSQTECAIRFIGLSTALANARYSCHLFSLCSCDIHFTKLDAPKTNVMFVL